MMKRFIAIIILCFVFLHYFALEKDTIQPAKLKANLDIGIGLNVHRIKYYQNNYIDAISHDKKTDYSFGGVPTLGASVNYGSFKKKCDFIWLKMVRFYVGYDFGKWINFTKNKKLYLHLNYSILDYFSYPTDLFGLELSYQYKKFEFYYTILKYRRFVALDAKEHQHILGVKYNLFRDK